MRHIRRLTEDQKRAKEVWEATYGDIMYLEDFQNGHGTFEELLERNVYFQTMVAEEVRGQALRALKEDGQHE